MKSFRLAILLFVLGSVFLVSAIAVSRQAALSGKLIRLHVVANSDSDEDQAEKLRVRDAILAVLSGSDAQCRDDAGRWIAEHLGEIERAAKSSLPEDTKVSVTLAQESFPTRAYDTFTLPAGSYLSLRVSIGTAQGHNWWCVIYPALCTASSFTEAGLTEEEASWITQNTAEARIEFLLLELLEKTF